MILIFFYVLVLFSCLPLIQSVSESDVSTPVCREWFSCPGLGWFNYPFYNDTDARCGLIKINCTSEGGEVQFGGRSYAIVHDKLYTGDLVYIRNQSYNQLVKDKSCDALMNNFTSPSPSPLLYSISIFPNITLFRCTKDYTSFQQVDAYFQKHRYNSYNKCNGHNFYYNYFNGTVPSDLPQTCQVVQLPANTPSVPELDETNIFSLLSSFTTLVYNLSQSCMECHKNGRLCDEKNGHVQCVDVIKGREPTDPDAGKKSCMECRKNGRLCDEKNGHVQCVDVKTGIYSPKQTDPEKQSGDRNRMIKMLVLGVGSIAILIVIVICITRKARRIKKAKYNVKIELFLKNHEFLAPKRYTYSQVEKMTNSFNVKLGQGGFGAVYKGLLKNRNPVAVKVLDEVKGDGEDFINEVASVGRTCHVNIVSLLGFCLEGRHRALIYEFMPNGSLERFIYSRGSSSNSQLGWEKLHQIAVGIARGLEYLHRGCCTRILHFDIKPHNILLDSDFCPKISDFGLAKLFREKQSKLSMSHMRGTPGYIAPELFSRNFGDVSHKSDVYSYGMMILEMVGGRKNIEVGVDHTSEIYFPHWIYKKVELHEENLGLHGIVCVEENRIAKKMIIVGLWCIQTNPLNRPTITRVLEMLEGDLALLEIPPKPYITSPSRCVGSPSTESLYPYCSST